MDVVAVLDQVIALLRQRGRVTYRTLQLQVLLDDAQLAALNGVEHDACKILAHRWLSAL
jgi:hypothetical protein